MSTLSASQPASKPGSRQPIRLELNALTSIRNIRRAQAFQSLVRFDEASEALLLKHMDPHQFALKQNCTGEFYVNGRHGQPVPTGKIIVQLQWSGIYQNIQYMTLANLGVAQPDGRAGTDSSADASSDKRSFSIVYDSSAPKQEASLSSSDDTDTDEEADADLEAGADVETDSEAESESDPEPEIAKQCELLAALVSTPEPPAPAQPMLLPPVGMPAPSPFAPAGCVVCFDPQEISRYLAVVSMLQSQVQTLQAQVYALNMRMEELSLTTTEFIDGRYDLSNYY